jgi:DNA-binding NarL/FixJ family response regulator
MSQVAIIEDDPPTSHQLKQWILSAKPVITVEQWFTREEAEAAIAREDYDLVILDIELGRERHAGDHLPQHHEGTRCLGLPAEDHLLRGRFRGHRPGDPAHRARSQPRQTLPAGR